MRGSVHILLTLALLLPRTGSAEEGGGLGLVRPVFPEERLSKQEGLDFHGYARMAVRTNGELIEARPPYLVDDNYYLSGFAYTRPNETGWAELFLSTRKERTRLVVGLLASQFSDWSEIKQESQGGISQAFVEDGWSLAEGAVDLNLRAGMFWERLGYIVPYDTYVFGRSHIGGIRAKAKLFDHLRLELGYGAHADVINANQGFTPMAWGVAGVELNGFEASLYALNTWTRDSQRQFSLVKDGSLRVLGAEVRGKIPGLGPALLAVSHVKAENALWLANSFEIVHSTGGRGLTENFFGGDSRDGSGELLVTAFDVVLRAREALKDRGDAETRAGLNGLDLRLFGMTAWTLSFQQSENPAENRHDRLSIKWGAEPLYRLQLCADRSLFAALRFDRVILDREHESLSFRIITPRLGLTFREGIEVFAAWSSYSYGANIRLRPNQVPGDPAAVQPDDSVFKLQVQASW